MKSIQTISLIALSLAIGAFGSYFFFGGSGEAVEKTVPGTRVVRAKVDGDVKKVTEVSLVSREGGNAVRIVETEVVRPKPGAVATGAVAETSTVSEEIDEDKLNATQKAVLKELQDALDDNNLKRVRKALSKFVAKAENGGLGGDVPVCMRAKAVEVLSWFGKDAAVDLIGFVADSNEDVSNDAFSALEMALCDCEMGDVARAQLVTSMMKALNDAEQVDSLMNQLNDMRNSVKADAAKEILGSGSETAKAKLLEDLETYFDEDVKDLDSLEKWKAMNPDDAEDSEIYGGTK